MSRAELELAIDWAAVEGWNPGLADATPFHVADPAGFLIGLVDGTPAAVISVVRYGQDFGFLGFYIAAPPIAARATACGCGRQGSIILMVAPSVWTAWSHSRPTTVARASPTHGPTSATVAVGCADATIGLIDARTLPFAAIERLDARCSRLLDPPSSRPGSPCREQQPGTGRGRSAHRARHDPSLPAGLQGRAALRAARAPPSGCCVVSPNRPRGRSCSSTCPARTTGHGDGERSRPRRAIRDRADVSWRGPRSAPRPRLRDHDVRARLNAVPGVASPAHDVAPAVRVRRGRHIRLRRPGRTRPSPDRQAHRDRPRVAYHLMIRALPATWPNLRRAGSPNYAIH